MSLRPSASVASMLLTLFLVIVGNAAAAGPVGSRCCRASTRRSTTIVPQGSGVALLRSIEYFGGNGARNADCSPWRSGVRSGCVLAVLATASRVNYRASHDRYRVAATIEPYYDLGSYHRSIDTPSPQAQIWFDRGLVWAYAFNHDESIRCFERALELDPDLAIARWGIAYAIGPNYNKAWEAFDPVDLAASLARARIGTRAGGHGAGVRARTRADRGAAGPLPHRRPGRRRRADRRSRTLRRRHGARSRTPTPTTSTSRRSRPTHW